MCLGGRTQDLPHVLPHPIRVTPEALRRNGEIVCLVLQRVKSLMALNNLGDVVSHDVDGIIDLCLNGSSLGVLPPAGISGIRGRATAGKVWVIRLRHVGVVLFWTKKGGMCFVQVKWVVA